MTQKELFETAVIKAKAGDLAQARDLLLALVEKQSQHELAWLWLSELVEAPEDKIIALENALTINPQRSQAQTRLSQLRQKYPQASQLAEERFAQNGFAQQMGEMLILTEEESRFAEVTHLLATADKERGRQELAAFLRRYSNHEGGWWLMVQHAESQTNLLVALDHLLRLNARHPDAPDYLEHIQPTNEQFLQMGRLNERLERWETAVYYYKRALKSPNNTDRLLAKKRLPQAEDQLKLSRIKVTSPTSTVIRLAIGPTILYGSLVLVQAGLNPLHTSPLLCLGNLAFLAGMLLLGGLSHAPDHPRLQQLRETAVFHNKRNLRWLSLALLLLPILLLLLHTLFRLNAFNLDLNSL
jgi:tetratricopeptide (TPR) repeat protein